MGLVGAVGEQQAVQVLKGQATSQLLRHLLDELFHTLLLHGPTLLPAKCGGVTDTRRHLTLQESTTVECEAAKSPE